MFFFCFPKIYFSTVVWLFSFFKCGFFITSGFTMPFNRLLVSWAANESIDGMMKNREISATFASVSLINASTAFCCVDVMMCGLLVTVYSMMLMMHFRFDSCVCVCCIIAELGKKHSFDLLRSFMSTLLYFFSLAKNY